MARAEVKVIPYCRVIGHVFSAVAFSSESVARDHCSHRFNIMVIAREESVTKVLSIRHLDSHPYFVGILDKLCKIPFHLGS